MAPEPPADDREAGELARSLAAMKRRGCWLLVAGRGAGCGHGRACRRLLGQDDGPPRRRVLVETAGDARVDTPAGAGAAATRIEVTGGQVRQAAVAAGNPDDGPDLPADRVPRSDLDALAAACREQVAAVERSADLAPAELRLCVDSLVPLVEANDRAAVAELVEAVGDRVRAARGMGHVHLPVARDGDAVAELSPLFDAVIAVRSRRGRVEHRWTLPDADLTSGWLEL